MVLVFPRDIFFDGFVRIARADHVGRNIFSDYRAHPNNAAIVDGNALQNGDFCAHPNLISYMHRPFRIEELAVFIQDRMGITGPKLDIIRKKAICPDRNIVVAAYVDHPYPFKGGIAAYFYQAILAAYNNLRAPQLYTGMYLDLIIGPGYRNIAFKQVSIAAFNAVLLTVNIDFYFINRRS